MSSTVACYVSMPYVDARERINLLEKSEYAKKLSIIFFIFSLFCCVTAYAAEPDLTEIFSTRAFQGAWEVVYQFNWLGKILNWIISVFCLIGLILIMFSRITTLLYLSAKNMWDNVYDIHEANQGVALGLPSLFRNTFVQGSYGMGFDAVVSLFYGLLPNAKKFSDYNPNVMGTSNLTEDDNALQYILKTLPNTILLMFFLSAGFNGTLARTYGTIVSAMSTFVDNALETNLNKYIDDIFEIGASPEFTLNADKTKKGSVQASIAKNIFSEAVSAAGIRDEQEKAQLAATCENLATTYFTEESVGNMLGVPLQSDSDWSKVKVTVKRSSNPNGTAKDKVIPVSEVVPSVQEESYIHVILTTGAQQVNYFGQSN